MSQPLLTHLTQSRDSLIERYGTGVRPSWVSGELAMLNHKIEKLKEKESEQG